MRFKVDGETILLKGDSSLIKSQLFLKTMIKAFKDGEQGMLLELRYMGMEEVAGLESTLSAVVEVLHRYRECLSSPMNCH